MAATDSDFFKSALPAHDGAHSTDDTSLALPREGELCGARSQPVDRSSRVQRQVQLTLARKGGKAPSNGNLQSQDPTSTPGYGVGHQEGVKDLDQEDEWKQRCDTVQKMSTYRMEGSLLSSPALSSCMVPGHRMLYSKKMHQGTYTLPAQNPTMSRTFQLSSTWSPGVSQHYNVQESHRSGFGSMRETYRAGPGSMRETFRSGGGNMRETFRSGGGNMRETFRSGGGSMRETFRSGGGRMRETFRGDIGWHQQRSFTDKSQLDNLNFLRTVRKGTGLQIDKQTFSPASVVSMDLDGLMEQTCVMQDIIQSEVGQVPGQDLNRQQQKGQVTELTLEKAVSRLTQENPDMQVTAANYIQHQCFISPQAKKKVFNLQGISKLIQLFHSDNEQLHRATAGALRNIVFENNDNKVEVKDKGGVDVLLSVLKCSRDIETRKQLTGLLWNLSSHDLLKDNLCKEALQILTDSVIVPCSGIAEGDSPKDYLLADPDTFYNATGCLRNLSSAGPESRLAMRKCIPLIDALVHYVQGTIADHKPDDKHSEKQVPLLEENSSPHGVEWLQSPIIVRIYLSLIARSSCKCTQEVATGALQNITAGNGMVPFTMAYTIVKKENGLQQVNRILNGDEPDVTRAAVCLLRNISRYKELHSDIVKEVLSKLIALLPASNSIPEVSSSVTVTLCQILTNLSQSEGLNVRAIVKQGGLGKIIKISTTENGIGPTRAGQAASVLLNTMWRHKELHSVYIKAGYRKADFINSKTVKALNSIENSI